MTIIEALSDERFRSGILWARSILWRGCGRAWRILKGSSNMILPFGASETPMEQYEVSRYTSEWELVEPAVIVKEFRHWENTAP